MKKLLFAFSILAGVTGFSSPWASEFENDSFETEKGSARITFIGHATLMIEFNGKVIHVDPVSAQADYSKLPKADIILVTHEHGDHFDPVVLNLISRPETDLVTNESVAAKFGTGKVMKNGDSMTVQGIPVQAVPAYNTTEGRSRFHPKGRDNGFVLNLGGLLVYIAGDTEDIPEMTGLKGIDVAFLPVNQPYTMTPVQAVNAAKQFKPRILYPYHYGDTDISGLPGALQNEGIEVRIRKLP